MKAFYEDPELKKLFPFFMIINKDLTVYEMSGSVASLSGHATDSNVLLDELIEVVRPNLGFELSLISLVKRKDQVFLIKFRKVPSVLFKFQVVIGTASSDILFIGNPIVKNIADLNKLNISINDLPLYDNTLDFIQLHRAEQLISEELARSLEKLETQYQELAEANNKIKELNDRLARKVKSSGKHLDNFMKGSIELSYSLGHDMKAPVRQVNSFAQFLKHRLRIIKVEDEKVDSILEQILNSSQRLLYMIEALRSFTNISTKASKLKLVDIRQAIEDAIAVLQGDNHQYAKHEIVLDIPEKYEVRTDRAMLDVILLNIIGNAFKYSKEAVAPTIEVGVYSKDTFLVIWVKDNGIGFDDKYKSQIFKLFSRLGISEEFEGTGIGLANTSRAVGRIGGSIDVRSRVGGPTVFEVTIPNT